MGGLKVLITNFRLAARTGTELYVRDLALRLLERGHTPIVYSPLLGELARELRRATVPVVDDPEAISARPDVIHGQHRRETMVAMLHFPGVPAAYFCHDWYSRADAPPRFPRVLRYVAIDQTCRDKLIFEHAVPEERVRVLPSFVDLTRFEPRGPLPARPARALVLCNLAEEDAHLGAVREACARAQITLDVIGEASGNSSARPGELLARYDLVFAKGRAALEALAVGTAVIVYFGPRAGPLVTLDEVDRLLPLNFGIRAMGRRLTPEALAQEVGREIARYDAADASAASRRVREVAGIDLAVEEIISLYEEVIAEQREAGEIDFYAEERAASAYIRQIQSEWAQSQVWRLRDRVMKVPVLGTMARSLARLADR